MVLLDFELSPSGCARLHDALTCLAKFSDTVSLEARFGQLVLSALNSSKSAYASINFTNPGFFTRYEFEADLQRQDERFTCRFLNKALLSVFRGKPSDARSEGLVERCEAGISEGSDGTECRFIIRMIGLQGVVKTYRLTYESSEIMQAVFNKGSATSHWRIQARALREYAEFFGPKTEQLDMCFDQDQFTLTSYTEKVMHGKEILKQPLQTAITVDIADFEEFKASEAVHIGISVKDFRNIVSHADGLKTTVTALYSYPSKPLQFSYSSEGMRCEFTLMTIGEFGEAAAPVRSRAILRESQQRVSSVLSAQGNIEPASDTSRLSRSQRPLGSRTTQPSQAPQEVEQESEGLFVPMDDDDRQWDPTEPREEDGEMLDWDASADNDAFRSTFQNHHNVRDQAQQSNRNDSNGETGIAPTQRASQYRGMFDE